jgi:hypothetical protein
MMEWAVRNGRTANGIVSKLREISSSLARWGATRATLEAASDISNTWLSIPPVEEIVGQMQGNLLMSAAEILGELDDPSAVALGRILDSIFPSDAGIKFIDRLLELAILSVNEGWLRWLAALPSHTAWAESRAWLGINFIFHTGNLLKAVWNNCAANARPRLAPIAQAAALRLRNWSDAPKLSTLLKEQEGAFCLHFMPLIAEHAPTQATLVWLQSHVGSAWWTRAGALNALPILVVRTREFASVLDKAALVELYR